MFEITEIDSSFTGVVPSDLCSILGLIRPFDLQLRDNSVRFCDASVNLYDLMKYCIVLNIKTVLYSSFLLKSRMCKQSEAAYSCGVYFFTSFSYYPWVWVLWHLTSYLFSTFYCIMIYHWYQMLCRCLFYLFCCTATFSWSAESYSGLDQHEQTSLQKTISTEPDSPQDDGKNRWWRSCHLLQGWDLMLLIKFVLLNNWGL